MKHVKKVALPWVGPREVSLEGIHSIASSNDQPNQANALPEMHNELPAAIEVKNAEEFLVAEATMDVQAEPPLANGDNADVQDQAPSAENQEILSSQSEVHCLSDHPGLSQVLKLNQQIEHHPYLTKLGLVVNTTLHCLCCEWCQIAIIPEHVAAHLKLNVHKAKGLIGDQAKLDETVEEMDIFECLPMTPETLAEDTAPAPYKGLAIHKGFQCTHCIKVTQSAEYMRKHFSSKHPIESKVNGWQECLVQRFTHIHQKKTQMWFRVATVPEAVEELSLSEKILADMKKELGKQLRVHHQSRNVDARNVSPWLKTTKWHEHLGAFEHKELLALSTPPGAKEFPGLQDAVEEYFEEATELLESMQELTLQKLNSPDPAKT
jgi:hypothetical protein